MFPSLSERFRIVNTDTELKGSYHRCWYPGWSAKVRASNHMIWTFLPSHNLLVFDDTPFQRYHLVGWKSKGEAPWPWPILSTPCKFWFWLVPVSKSFDIAKCSQPFTLLQEVLSGNRCYYIWLVSIFAYEESWTDASGPRNVKIDWNVPTLLSFSWNNR